MTQIMGKRGGLLKANISVQTDERRGRGIEACLSSPDTTLAHRY